MIIDQLPTVSLPVQDTDELPIERGTQTYKVSVGNSFVNKAGDTMTGQLVINADVNQVLVLKNSTDDATVNPGSAFAGRAIVFVDKNNVAYGYVRPRHYPNGNMGLWLYALNPSGIPNSLGLYIDASGNRTVDITAAPWLSALGLGTSGALPITVAQGGTGATTAEGAADALDVYKHYAIYSGNGITSSVNRKLSFSGGVAGLLLVTGTAEARCGLYILQATASAVIVKPIVAASACTITTGTGFLTITASSGTIYGALMTTSSLSRISETSA